MGYMEAKPMLVAPLVLVVEDERPIRDIMVETLREAGFRVEQVGNGAEALAHMRRQPPDVIVLDLMMPVMDGAGFTTLLRLNPSYADVPIVVVSATYDAPDAASRLGAIACIRKPFLLEDLVDAVKAALDSRPAAAVAGDELWRVPPAEVPNQAVP